MPIHDAIRQRLQPVAASVTSNRIMLYAFFSSCAMLGAIANACINQSNFYSVMIHLSRSGRSVLILANFGFLATLFIGRVLQKIFFGTLQAREVERLYDQTWMFVTESLLAFTIFRDEFDIPFVLMFGFLLFVKCFHWLMADRVESMDQVTFPGPPMLFHIRMNALFLTLTAIDFIMFTIAVDSTMNNGVGGMVLFATEYAILMASSLNAMARYSLNNLDYRRAHSRGRENAPPWENKSMYVFYIELVTDFLKLATYLTFFTIILTFYGLPLNIIRDVYLTARSFITRLRALIRYHNATRDMDRRYPNATEEELNAMTDRTCIICREELVSVNPAAAPAAENANGTTPPAPPVPAPPVPPAAPAQQDGPNMTPKKLPCGHIFHFQCLRSWLERQQSCPTCRRTVLETDAGNRNANQQRQQQRQPANGAPRPGAPQQQGAAAPQPFQPLQPGLLPQPPQNQGFLMGFLRRALGIAAQPPLVPGQFPNQFVPQQFPHAPPPYLYGPNLPPPPPGYYYAPHPYMHYPQPQQLQPAPIVRGFYGPGGVWHAWPGDPAQPEDARNQNPPPAPTPSAAQPQPHSQPLPAAGPVPVAVPLAPGQPMPVPGPALPSTSTSAAQSHSQSESSSSLSSVSSSDESDDDDDARTPSGSRSDQANPRDAAALAALRRLGGLGSKSSAGRSSASGSATAVSSGVEVRPSLINRSASTVDSSAAVTSSSSSTSSTSTATATPAPTQPQPVPTPTTPAAHAEAPAPGSSSTTNASSTGPQRAPALLPLYDANRPVGSQGVQYVYPQAPYPMPNPYYPNVYGAPGWRQPAGTARPANPTTGFPYPATRPSPYPTGSSHAHTHSARAAAASSSRSFRPNLSTLPSTLTEEQLGRLDRLTRDAIDERLRVLENVSTAVHRCIEELTRVRSVLPPGSVGSALTGAPMGQPHPALGTAPPVASASGAASTSSASTSQAPASAAPLSATTSATPTITITPSEEIPDILAPAPTPASENPSEVPQTQNDNSIRQWSKVKEDGTSSDESGSTSGSTYQMEQRPEEDSADGGD